MTTTWGLDEYDSLGIAANVFKETKHVKLFKCVRLYE